MTKMGLCVGAEEGPPARIQFQDQGISQDPGALIFFMANYQFLQRSAVDEKECALSTLPFCKHSQQAV